MSACAKREIESGPWNRERERKRGKVGGYRGSPGRVRAVCCSCAQFTVGSTRSSARHWVLVRSRARDSRLGRSPYSPHLCRCRPGRRTSSFSFGRFERAVDQREQDLNVRRSLTKPKRSPPPFSVARVTRATCDKLAAVRPPFAARSFRRISLSADVVLEPRRRRRSRAKELWWRLSSRH